MSSRTGLTLQGARKLIQDAVARGWLSEVGAQGRGGRIYWVATEVFAIVDAPGSYD